MSDKNNVKLYSNDWITQSNELIEVRNSRMTITQMRLFSCYLSKINPNDPSTREVTIKLDEYARIMEFKRLNITRISKAADDLIDLKVTIWDKNNKLKEGFYGFFKFHIFKNFKLYRNEDGESFVTLNCSDEALPLMFELKNYYTKYRLGNVLRLTSTNQHRMYELLKQYEYVGIREINVKDLREFLGLEPHEYPRWDNFKTRVLDASQQALENYTDIKFTWEVVGKRGRGGKIKKIKFNIEKNPNFNQCTVEDYMNSQPEPETDGELTDFDYENDYIGFMADACENSFNKGQMLEINSLLLDAIPLTTPQETKEKRYQYLSSKYIYSKNRSTGTKKNALFNYLKAVIEADIKQLQ